MVRVELNTDSVRDTEEESYLEYRVIHDDGSEGSADLRIRELSDSYIRHELREEGLPDNTKVAEFFFYPHSQTSQRRTGVASRVLDYILEDARRRDVKVVFCEVTNTAMKGFCESKGFRGNYAPHCYVLI